MTNPLVTLGLPLNLIALERSEGGLSRIMQLAENQYKGLSKFYHPDRPGGSEQIMALLTQARNELDSLDTLEYYVDELLGEEDIEKLVRQRLFRERAEQQQQAYQSAVQLLAYSNQFEMLGITMPTSFLVDFMDERLIIDVLAPDKTKFSLVDSSGSGEIPGLYARYSEGVWSESLTDEDLPDRRIRYTHVRSQGDVRVIGGVAFSLGDGLGSGPLISAGGLLEGLVPQGVVWSQVSQAWFMPRLGPYRDGDQLVVMKNGLVAITGMVLASAAL